MSNHAYESAAALRPGSNGPVPIRALCERFSLVPASADDAAALEDLSVLGVSVDSGDTAPGELFAGLPSPSTVPASPPRPWPAVPSSS